MLFIPTYFSPISQYSAMISAEKIVFEMEDNFQKQTYRNRCYIYGPNGKQLLNIPVKHHNTEGRKKTKDTLVENDFPWQDQHFKSLKVAYRSSPFFEFFEDDLARIFNKKHKFLYDVNIDTFLFIADILDLDQNFTTTKEYSIIPKEKDSRNLAIAKQEHFIDIPKYKQNFEEKAGFIKNLSVLDLIFMEGANSISFL